MIKFLALVLVVQAVVAAPSSSIITPELQSALKSRGNTNIFITMKEGTSEVIQSVTNNRFANRGVKLNALHAALVNHAEKTQQPILNLLSKKPNEVRSFWITNQIYVKQANTELVNTIVEQFGDQIQMIDEEFVAHLIEPAKRVLNVTKADEYQWGITKIEATKAWEHIGGLDHAGEGVVIGTVDTGVRVTHEALKNNFAGEYGWYDPSTKTSVPSDENGHGTHTTGTIVGGKGIGVAPKAKWASCRGCSTFFCTQPDLIACGEFFMCPTRSDGTNKDCTKAPNVVSNSWGGGRGNTWYNDVIQGWHAAGIIPVFSIGNSGPSCNTANSPGDQNVIAVGSTTIDDEISYFSSVGPTTDMRMKPDISAPGSDVISAYHTADDAYASLSGTSMACPHAAGTIALLQTREREIKYERASKLLLGTADQSLRFSGRVCEGTPDDKFPNHVFGNGRINALKTVVEQTKTM